MIDAGDLDGAIADRAIGHLRADLAAGLDHLMMARVNRIGRAREMRELYAQRAPDLNPVLLHSAIAAKDRKAALSAISDRSSRIIVCVDMLGEGFDLPSLKVAAIHDPHRSLGVTLQFVGRFARVAGEAIGEATVVVGRPRGGIDPLLRRLYGEDADWNGLIRDLSERAVTGAERLTEFENGFGSQPDNISIRSLVPKMSTVVYQTSGAEWDVSKLHEAIPEEDVLTLPVAVNERDRVAWFVAVRRSPVQWGDLTVVEDVVHDLYVLHFDHVRQLLFINCSNTGSVYEDIAKAVCGHDVVRVTGERVYRAMAGIERLVPTNVGVLDIRNQSRRFSMHVGADVIEGFPTAEAVTKTKTNIFASGIRGRQPCHDRGVTQGPHLELPRCRLAARVAGLVWAHRSQARRQHHRRRRDHGQLHSPGGC